MHKTRPQFLSPLDCNTQIKQAHILLLSFEEMTEEFVSQPLLLCRYLMMMFENLLGNVSGIRTLRVLRALKSVSILFV